jgi:hypothetical protein
MAKRSQPHQSAPSGKSPFKVFGGSAKEAISALNKAPIGELVKILSTSGLRPHPAFTWFAELRLRLLEPFRIGPDCQRLEQNGLQKETMTIALMVINIAPGFDDMFHKFGDARSRQRQVKQLLTPIAVLKEFQGMTGNTIKQFPPTILLQGCL